MNKKSIVTVVLMAFVILSSCEDPHPNSFYDHHFWLNEGQSIIISSSNQNKNYPNVTVSLEEVNDSRCPADAICISAGNAILTLNAGGETVRLCISDCDAAGLSNTANFIYNNVAFTLQVLEVQPFPMTANQGKVKKARLVVSRE